ncbi:MAG: sugar phosphate isomerase/epimerase [Bacteroidetes bacterium]|nr:MAG: sugar phosphate isomerase/epimerase [Bacteroidota bacterium]
MSRRNVLGGLGAGLLASLLPYGCQTASEEQAANAPAPEPFLYCLNMSTIRGQQLGFLEELEVAARAGFTAVEIWIPSLQSYLEEGGSLAEVNKRLKALGLTVENAIGFATWIVDDPQQRQQGMQQAREEMDLLARIGCKRIAAPPAGATEAPGLDLLKAAERYAALLDLGAETGVKPQLEVWGFSANLHLLGQAMLVAAESRHAHACLLPDVYHLYRGGSGFEGLHLLSGSAIEMFHLNDYPATPAREALTDAHRVYPGDGVAPLNSILKSLARGPAPTVLSLELFNRDYWQQDALEVAQTGLKKMQAVVKQAVGE